MDDAFGVRRLETRHKPAHDVDALLRATSLPLRVRMRAQVLTLDELHGDELHAVGFVQVVDADDVLMRDLPRQHQFLLEARQNGGIARKIGTNDLQSDNALHFHVAGLVDRAHAAHAEQLLDLVAAAEDVALMEDGGADIGEDWMRWRIGLPGRGLIAGTGDRTVSASERGRDARPHSLKRLARTGLRTVDPVALQIHDHEACRLRDRAQACGVEAELSPLDKPTLSRARRAAPSNSEANSPTFPSGRAEIGQSPTEPGISKVYLQIRMARYHVVTPLPAQIRPAMQHLRAATTSAPGGNSWVMVEQLRFRSSDCRHSKVHANQSRFASRGTHRPPPAIYRISIGGSSDRT